MVRMLTLMLLLCCVFVEVWSYRRYCFYAYSFFHSSLSHSECNLTIVDFLELKDAGNGKMTVFGKMKKVWRNKHINMHIKWYSMQQVFCQLGFTALKYVRYLTGTTWLFCIVLNNYIVCQSRYWLFLVNKPVNFTFDIWVKFFYYQYSSCQSDTIFHARTWFVTLGSKWIAESTEGVTSTKKLFLS